jgi:hypothetical protein
MDITFGYIGPKVPKTSVPSVVADSTSVTFGYVPKCQWVSIPEGVNWGDLVITYDPVTNNWR